ncbi:MAG: SDR family oxidoreductase [Desulfobulbaceae bacterium]|nr:SDR family oxidoreductase [Desulfobulbaceae bacterium]
MKETILITGANRGIGLELARIFERQGWEVIACCRRPAQASDLQAIEAGSGGGLTIRQLDVTSDEEIRQLAVSLRGRPIAILFNNAGILGPEEQDFGNLAEEEWLGVFRVNTIGPYKMVLAFLDNVLLSHRRVIATLGSAMGSISENSSGGYYIYRSAKAAVHMIMKNLSIDLRQKGVTAVAMHPGWVRTRLGGPQAPLGPAESAAGLFEVLTSLTPEKNGALLDYQGRELAW